MNIVYIVTEHATYVGEEDTLSDKGLSIIQNAMQVKEVMLPQGPVILGTKLGELAIHCPVLASVILDKDSPVYKNYAETYNLVKIAKPTHIKEVKLK